jgi:phosphate transport system protein
MTVHFVNLLDELRRRSLRMASQVEDIVEEACAVAFERNEALARRVIARDAEVDREEVAVESEVVRLMALYQPVGIDLRLLCTVLKVNNDLERIADCAVNIAERSRHQEIQPLAEQSSDLKQMFPVVRQILRNAVQAYGTEDAEAARRVLAEDEQVDALYGQIVRSIVACAPQSSESMAGHLDLLSVAKNLERIADHATNIAEDVVFLSTGEIVRHQTAGPPSADLRPVNGPPE